MLTLLTDNYGRPADPRRAVRQRRKHAWVTGLIIAALALFVTAWALVAQIGHQFSAGLSAEFDPVGKGVVITSCKRTSQNAVEVSGTARNSSPKPSYFLIGLVVSEKSGAHVDNNAGASLDQVDPGRTAVWKASASTKFATSASCALSMVVRGPTTDLHPVRPLQDSKAR